MRRCTKCVLPESYPGIAFNEQGVCNYCLTYEKREYAGEEELISIIDQYKNYNKDYDCIVGLSGGRDSSYLLHYTVKVLHLKVLAYTIDNGFIPEQTKSNIESMTRMLNVEHVIEKHDYTKRCIKHFISSWMHRPSPAMVSSMCVGCRLAMILSFLRISKRYKIPLFLTGGGEPEESFATRFFTTNSKRGTENNSLLVGYILEVLKNPAYLLSPIYLMTAFLEYICYFSNRPMLQKLISPNQEIVQIFDYIEWDEKKILSVIKNELKWEKYSGSKSSWRSDCKINILKNYFYKKTVGFTKNDELLGSMIREDMITREEALERLANENAVSERFVTEFLDEIGLDYRDLDVALRKAQ